MTATIHITKYFRIFSLAMTLAAEHILIPSSSPLLTLYLCIFIATTSEGHHGSINDDIYLQLNMFLLAGITEDLLQFSFPVGTYCVMFVVSHYLITVTNKLFAKMTITINCLLLSICGLITTLIPNLLISKVEYTFAFLTSFQVAAAAFMLVFPYVIVKSSL